MKTLPRFLLLVVLAVFLHITLGWPWTAVAGLAAGWWMPSRGWLLGAGAVGLDYLMLVGFSFLVNAAPVARMAETMGQFLGNMPSFVVVAVTILVGILIGALSGGAGSQLRRLVERHAHRARMV